MDYKVILWITSILAISLLVLSCTIARKHLLETDKIYAYKCEQISYATVSIGKSCPAYECTRQESLAIDKNSDPVNIENNEPKFGEKN